VFYVGKEAEESSKKRTCILVWHQTEINYKRAIFELLKLQYSKKPMHLHFESYLWNFGKICHNNSCRDWHVNEYGSAYVFGLGGIDLLSCYCRVSTET